MRHWTLAALVGVLGGLIISAAIAVAFWRWQTPVEFDAWVFRTSEAPENRDEAWVRLVDGATIDWALRDLPGRALVMVQVGTSAGTLDVQFGDLTAARRPNTAISRPNARMHECGWPARALRVRWFSGAAFGASSPLRPHAPGAWQGAFGRPASLRPLPLGLACDALFYALVLLTPYAGVRAIRRRRRIARRQCAACAYSRSGIPPEAPCPECGYKPRLRPAAASADGH